MINRNISFLLQLTKTAESADSDDKTFSSYVEMLKQKGHVMDSSSTLHNMVKSYVLISIIINVKRGAHWLSGRVLDSRPKGLGFQPHGFTALWSLSKTHLFQLSTGSTQEDLSLFN